MVDWIGFGGAPIAVLWWQGGIGDFTKEGGGILHQGEGDGSVSVLRKLGTGFEGIVKGIAKDDAKVIVALQ